MDSTFKYLKNPIDYTTISIKLSIYVQDMT